MYLIGMPGSGKSTLGHWLSQFWSMPFFDLDKEIEKLTGQNIPYLFENHGEAFFRLKEMEALRHLIITSEEPAVIAAGGGTPCFYDNLAMMKASGLVVFLTTPHDTVLQRLAKNQANSRPLLKESTNKEASWMHLWKQREPVYRQAHLIIDPSSLSREELARRITETNP